MTAQPNRFWEKIALFNWICILILFYAGSLFAKPMVIVSVEPLALITREICQDDCAVSTLVPRGVSEHSWAPGPKDMVKAKSASASIGIGLVFDEPWYQKIGTDPNTLLWLGLQLDPQEWWSRDWAGKTMTEFGDDSHDKTSTNERDHHHHGHLDPHLWTDPVRMASAATLIGRHLAILIPGPAPAFVSRSKILNQRLLDLSAMTLERRKKWNIRPVVMFHDLAGYFARRYNLPVVAVSSGHSEQEISANQMVELARRLAHTQVAAIMVERADGTVKNLARELKTNVKIVDFSANGEFKNWDDWYLKIVHAWEDVLNSKLLIRQ